ncbi:MAG: TIGR04255 family protein [Candidatus Longimicrobiales bacterium M2_2A_002]
MAQIRHLDNAPISEALIDVRVKPQAALETSALRELPDKIRQEFPTLEEKRVFEGVLKLQPGKEEFQTKAPNLYGFLHRSEDGRNVVQFRRDGFTFSRLKPYTEWEKVVAEAQRLWHVYLGQAAPQMVTRIAVRYINHIRLPLPMEDFGDYLLAPPALPESAPSSISNFLSRVTLYYPEQRIAVNLTQSLESAADADDQIVILLDIDAFIADDFEPESVQIWDELWNLRDRKNELFFGSITERTAELFE